MTLKPFALCAQAQFAYRCHLHNSQQTQELSTSPCSSLHVRDKQTLTTTTTTRGAGLRLLSSVSTNCAFWWCVQGRRQKPLFFCKFMLCCRVACLCACLLVHVLYVRTCVARFYLVSTTCWLACFSSVSRCMPQALCRTTRE